jgi:hypothetical protein
VSQDTDYEQSEYSVHWAFSCFSSFFGFVEFTVVTARSYGLEIGLIPVHVGEDSYSVKCKHSTTALIVRGGRVAGLTLSLMCQVVLINTTIDLAVMIAYMLLK